MHDTLFIGSRHITSYVDSYYIVGTNLSTDKSVENAIISYGNYSASTEFTKTNCGDGTVPTWSADLGGTNQSKTFYAVNRDHTGALNNDGTVKSEGLVVSDNIITKIKQIIDGNPNGNATGITTTRPVYASNGWTQGVNDEYTSLTFSNNANMLITNNNDNGVIYSKFDECETDNIIVEEMLDYITIEVFGKQSIKIETLDKEVEVEVQKYKLGECVDRKTIKIGKEMVFESNN